MRAATVTAFGDPDQLQLTKAADPRPGPGQCLIAIEACDVLFLDTMLRSGQGPPEMLPTLPWIPGNGIAGRVAAVGEGVSEPPLDRRPAPIARQLPALACPELALRRASTAAWSTVT